MVNPNPSFLSNRVRKKNQSGITSDRYQFLGLDQAEPDLGDPLVGPSSIGVNPYTGAIEDVYILVADTSGSGKRYWSKQTNVIAGGVVSPGSITVRNAGEIIGSTNQITDVNFVGSGVTVINPASWVGAGSSSVDISITVTDVSLPSGPTGAVAYKDASGLLQGSQEFIFNPANSRVGIGSTLPKEKLDVNGNVVVSGTITAGVVTAVSGTFTESLKVGNFEISDSTTFVRIVSGSVGIGSTQPKADLDVLGDVHISGIATISRIDTQNIRVASASSFGSVSIGSTQVISSSRQLQNIISLDTITTATIEDAIRNAPNTFTDLDIIGIATIANLGVTGITTTQNLLVTGITTLPSLGVNGLTTTRDLQVSGITTLYSLDVEELTTTQNLLVTGITTLPSLGVIGLTTTRDLRVSGIATIERAQVTNVSVSSSVGIGTTNALYDLDVNGDIRLTGNLVVNNGSGSSGQVLISDGNNPPNWGSPSEVTAGSATSVTTFDRNGISTSYYITFVEKTSGNQSISLDSNNLTYNPSTNTLSVDAISTKNIEVEGLSRVTTGVITTSSKNEVVVDNLNTTLFRSARYNIQVNTIGQLSLSSTTSVSGLNSGTNYYPGTYNNIALNNIIGSGTDARANITVSPQATLPIVGSINGTFTTSGSLVGIGTSQSIVFTQTLVPGPYENSRVTDITLTNVGSGYTSIPTFNFSSPIIQGNPVEAVGVGSTATGIVSSVGVSNIIFNNVGFITTLVPTVTISPSSGTTATANVSYGISTILVTDNGIGYLSIPTVQFSSGSIVAGVSTIFVNKIRVTNPGFGYTTGDLNTSFVFSSGIVSATNNSFSLPNSFTAFTITNPGAGYTAPPILTVDSPQIGVNTGAVEATLGISTVVISQPGSGYTVSPSFNVEPSVTSFSGYVGAGVSSSGILLFGGGGYDSNPTVSFIPVGGIGTGAQADAQINISGQVESITITNPGFGYTVPPLVVFNDGTPEVSAAATIRTLVPTNFVVTNIGFGATEVSAISIGSTTVEFLDNPFTKTGTVGIATTSRVDNIIFSSQGTLSIASTTIISGISTFDTIITEKTGNVDTINDTTITGIDISNVSVGFAVTGNFVQVATSVASVSSNNGGTIGLTTNLTNPSVGFGLTFFISDTLTSRVLVGQGVSGPNINLTESGTTVISIGNSSVTLSGQTLNSGIQTSTFNFGTLAIIPGVFQTNVITGISTSGISASQRIIGDIIQSNTNISAVGVGSITINNNTTNTSVATTTFTLFDVFTVVGTGASAIASMGIGRVTVGINTNHPLNLGFGTGYTTLPGIAVTAIDGVTGGGGIVTTSSFGIDTDCIRVTNFGVYNSIPSVLITPPKNGSGSGATANVGIGISTIIVSSPGSNTGTKPTISFSGGSTLVSAAATVNNIILNNVSVVNSGSGYTSSNLPVTATFSNVSLGATVGLSVENITLTSSGLGYTTTPSISFSSPDLSGGVSATATATLANFGSSFNLLPGPGYGNTFVYYIEPITNNTFRLYRNINRTNQINIGFSTVGNPNALVGGRVSNVSINQSGSGYQNGNILSASSVSLGNTFSSNVGTGFSFTVSNTVQNYQISDLMLLQSVGSANTSADIIEYGSISNLESLIDFSADISGSNARLKVTSKYRDNTVKISRTSITI
jgi:hypothetical protein